MMIYALEAAGASASGAVPGAVLMAGFLLGACLGSLVQTAALKLNRGETTLMQTSKGQTSKEQASKSRKRIAPLHIIIQASMGSIAVVMLAFYPLLIAIGLIGGVALMLISVLTDFESMTLHLPALIGLGLLGGGLSFMPFWPSTPLLSFMGLVAVLLLIGGINLIYFVLRGQSGFGAGDYWLLGAVGLWLGPVLAVGLFFIAAMLGAAVGIFLMLIKRGTPQTALPFGVFVGFVFICWPIFNILMQVSWQG